MHHKEDDRDVPDDEVSQTAYVSENALKRSVLVAF